MKALEEILGMLSDHLDATGDTLYTDRELLAELRKRAQARLEEDKIKVSEAGVDRAKPSTVYEIVTASMTPQKLANLGVKLISVNNRDLFWVTSMGQLYDYKAYEQAMQDEYSWLMSDPNK